MTVFSLHWALGIGGAGFVPSFSCLLSSFAVELDEDEDDNRGSGR